MHDALGAHARDELGINEIVVARPVQAALTSAAAFAIGAALPLAMVALLPGASIVGWLAATSLLFLVGLGVLAARVGGAPPLRAAARVVFWGAAAMAATAWSAAGSARPARTAVRRLKESRRCAGRLDPGHGATSVHPADEIGADPCPATNCC